jgi:putative ABC transport system permease protein
LLLFFSAAGFFLKISQLNKKFYYKNLNMFILKQVNNKVNTTVLSNTVISLMLLLTIGILSSSISLVSVFNSAITKNNMTDFSITEHQMICNKGDITYCYDKVINDKIKDIPNKEYFKDSVDSYVYYSIFDIDTINAKSLIDDKSMKELKEEYGNQVNFEGTIDIISESSYNEILKLYGKNTVDIKENEYLLTSNLEAISKYYKSFYENNGSIKIKDKSLTPSTKEIVDISLLNSSGGSNVGTIVVDDSIVSILNNKYGVIIGNYKGKDKENIEEKLKANLEKDSNENNNYNMLTKINMEVSSIGIKAIFTFVGLYLGIVFAISSATILAIGQLSESADYWRRRSPDGKAGRTV